jgi:hypothetical protein
MSELKTILKDYQTQKKIANIDLSDVPPQAYSGRLGKVKRAKENIAALEEDYLGAVRNNCLFILATGEKTDDFAQIAEEEYGCFTLGSDDFYNELISDLSDRLYVNKTLTPAIFDIVGRKIEEMALELGIQSYPFLAFEQKYKKNTANKKELMEVVRQAINDKIGAEMVGLYSTFVVAKKALDEEFDAKVIPIVLKVEEAQVQELAQSLNRMFGNIFMIDLGIEDESLKNKAFQKIDSINKTNIKKTLVSIKKSMV